MTIEDIQKAQTTMTETLEALDIVQKQIDAMRVSCGVYISFLQEQISALQHKNEVVK